MTETLSPTANSTAAPRRTRTRREEAEALARERRAEFWSLPNDAWVTRDIAAAAAFLSRPSMELHAKNGTGPKYRGRGRGSPTLYLKQDVIDWLACTGRMVRSTAELENA